MDLTKVKNLLKEAIKTGDEELIEMATALLEQNNTGAARKQPSRKKALTNNQNNDFTLEIKNKENKSVKATQRSNLFVDDGTEFIGEEFKTPAVPLTERKREPTKTIDQKCRKCNNVVSVHPTHKRDWFYCDKCLSSIGRR